MELAGNKRLRETAQALPAARAEALRASRPWGVRPFRVQARGL